MRVLFIGGTGRLSKDSVLLAIKKGFDVTLLNRGSNNRKLFVPDGCTVLKGDVRRPGQLKKMFKNQHFDVVVDYLTFNPRQMKDSLDTFKEIAGQYIFISSATVYQKKEHEIISEKETERGNREWEYAYNKFLCEELIKAEYQSTDGCFTIVRPYVTYGNTRVPYPLVPQNSLYEWSLIDRIQRGGAIPVFYGGELPTTLTHTRDFAKGIVGLFGNNKACNEDFHIASDDLISWNEVLDIIENKLSVQVNRAVMSQEDIYGTLPEYRGILLGDKGTSWVFDNSKIHDAVPDFACSVGLEEGLGEMLDFYRTHSDLQLVDYSWDGKMDRLCEEKGLHIVADYADLTIRQMKEYKQGKSAQRSAAKRIGASIKTRLKR